MGFPKEKNSSFWIVFYTGIYGKTTMQGIQPIEVFSFFLNMIETVDFICNDYGFDNVMITNFKKVTEAEYREFNRKP